MNNDLSLRPILAKHLGAKCEEDLVLSGYANHLLALKFFDLFSAGHRKLTGVRIAEDSKAIGELNELLERADEKYLSLSRHSKDLLQTEFEILRDDLGSNTTGAQCENDKTASANSDTGIDVDLPEGEMVGYSGKTMFFQYLSELVNVAHNSKVFMDDLSVRRKVDWRVVSVSHFARHVWEIRLGLDAPKSAHADAPGPFGNFLEDILTELFEIFEGPSVASPSARSALRSLKNVTNTEVLFPDYW